nr:MAG TPA: hypothetical protein [Caudoviricetes sp.]
MKRTAKSIQADIAKGAFRPHTALSTMALLMMFRSAARDRKKVLSDGY